MVGHLEHIDSASRTFRHSREVASGAQSIVTLQNEHKTILEHSRELVKITTQTGSKRVAKLAYRKKVADECAILRKLLTSHEKDEERIILPIMLKHFDTESTDIIRNENAELFQALRKLSESASRVKHLQMPKSVKALAKASARFDALVRAHVSREENVTYWFASLRLSDRMAGARYGQE